MELREDDVVFCTVKKIEGTTVFVEIEGSGEGSLVLSEVAAGRIRNLREYVSINKKIVCKVLKISGERIELSLRRVTAKERDDVLTRHKREKAFGSVMKVVGENPEKIIEAIKKKYDFLEFLDSVGEDKNLLGEFLGKDKIDKVFKILVEKEEKEKVVEGKFKLSDLSSDGIGKIKKVLDIKDVRINYLGSSVFSVSVSGRDFKEANQKIEGVMKQIEENAKKEGVVFSIKKSK